MALIKKKLITIIVPETAEPAVADALSTVTRGFSAVAAGGRGKHGERPDVWHSGNFQIETIVDVSEVDRVLAVLEPFLPGTPLLAWVSDVEAWPAARFG